MGRPDFLLDGATTAPPTPVQQGSAAQPVPALTIAAHPVTSRIGERFLFEAASHGAVVPLSRNEPDFAVSGSMLGAPLGDPFLSRKPLLLSQLPDGALRVRASAAGLQATLHATERRPIDQDGVVLSADDLVEGVPIEIANRVVVLLHVAPSPLSASSHALGMLGSGTGIERVRHAIRRIHDLDVPVLILGETGTGKELVARAIHDHGPRRAGPFVSVNLGAIPHELAAAELFGAMRGSYTGSTRDRSGLFQAAAGGTLFLDEIGEASTDVQVLLLRVLESGELYRVGGRSPERTTARVLAATDADLEVQIRSGRFKAPLLHRLAGFEIRVPPLRERREDIGSLFFHFAREQLTAIGEVAYLDGPRTGRPGAGPDTPWLPSTLAVRLLRHRWPGNIRQLRNVARQMVIASRGQPSLDPDARVLTDPDALASPATAPAGSASAPPVIPLRRKPSEVGEDELLETLARCGWDLRAAADALGISRPSIYDLVERHPHARVATRLDDEEVRRCHRECGGDVGVMVERLRVSRRGLMRRLKELGLPGP